MPFADYEDFEECERANSDKRDPAAYCAAIERAAEQGLDPDAVEVAHREAIGLEAESLDALAEQSAEWTRSDGDGVVTWVDSEGEALVYEQGVPDDAVSISDPSEAPDDARLITGPRGGSYYVPADGDDGGSDGDGGDDGPPPSVDLSREVDSTSLEEAGITGGENSPNMRIAELDDGSEVFVEGDSHPVLAGAAVTGSQTYESLGVPVPDHHFDEETGALAKEAIDGTTIRDIHLEEQDVDVDEESVVDAFAASLIAGDTDMHAGNMMIDEDGQAVPIDIDGSGGIVSDPEVQQQKIEQNLDMLGADVTFEDVQDRVGEMASDADLSGVEGEFADQIRENAEALAA